jgi:hypothetical protein
VTIAKRPSYRVQDARASKGDLPDGTSGILDAPQKPLRLSKAEIRSETAGVSGGPCAATSGLS